MRGIRDVLTLKEPWELCDLVPTSRSDAISIYFDDVDVAVVGAYLMVYTDEARVRV